MAKYIDVESIIARGPRSVSMCVSSDYARGYNELFKALTEAPYLAMYIPSRRIVCPRCGAKINQEVENAPTD